MSFDLYIGVDPGKTGALAILGKDGRLFENFLYDFSDRQYFINDFNTLFSSMSVKAYLENVHSMPCQGVASTFLFGEVFGWWKGAFEALGIDFSLITPQAWQKKFSLRKTADCVKPSLMLARGMFPEADLHLKKHHNRADALLIARACWLDRQKELPWTN